MVQRWKMTTEDELKQHKQFLNALIKEYCNLIKNYSDRVKKDVEKDRDTEDLKQQIAYMRSTLELMEETLGDIDGKEVAE